jgi:hypothetical protein
MAVLNLPENLARGPTKSGRLVRPVGRNCQETSVHYLLNALKCRIIGSFEARWNIGFGSGTKKEQ